MQKTAHNVLVKRRTGETVKHVALRRAGFDTTLENMRNSDVLVAQIVHAFIRGPATHMGSTVTSCIVFN